mmetsp:Transcript_88496/g.235495  ORF Transcript_88496/g.235495 Transcript_88496/m.235495 type:complete len:109 (+) Transcript_88496:1584-1910(+)
MESNFWKMAVEGWWMVHTTAMPSSLLSFFRKSTIQVAEVESRPLVGSSRKRTRGFLMRARPRERRRFCPPDSPLTKRLPQSVLAHPSRPRCLRVRSTSSFFSAAESDM